MVALVGIARAVVSMTVSASDAATVADKVGATLIFRGSVLCSSSHSNPLRLAFYVYTGRTWGFYLQCL